LGSAPNPAEGTYSAPPGELGFRGLLLRGGEGVKEKGTGGKGSTI